MKTLDVLFTPADFGALKSRPLDDTLCVVFDVFRATSSMVTALANGAEAIIPAGEIPEALEIKRRAPAVLLAGERDGVRIRAALANGTDFDLGNSPREFTQEKVSGRTIVMTTTNGTRALRSCAHAKTVLAGSFLNLRATAEFISRAPVENLFVICSGTHEQSAYEDVLGAGALCDLLWGGMDARGISDSAKMARQLYTDAKTNLEAAASQSRNGLRLEGIPELREDVPFCLQRDVFDFVAVLDRTGSVKKYVP
ncbi:MAG TPA: 2-phosphosulfolactate phosphatase [Verrucomicrobiae bacterium]|jgi:2-phosphosulfolactate phosphatase|nr:2-phosphosulfolactate phosphatase [Verrucomicrobiae bacterium]